MSSLYSFRTSHYVHISQTESSAGIINFVEICWDKKCFSHMFTKDKLHDVTSDLRHDNLTKVVKNPSY